VVVPLKYILALLLTSLLFSAVFAEEPTLSFPVYADGLLTEPALRGASWGIFIYSLGHDAVIYEKDADRLLTPASVTKLFTSAAALDALGAGFQFATIFSGALTEDGILRGDLAIRAGGDPTAETKNAKWLGAPVLFAVADSLAARGVRRIAGDVVLFTWPYRLECATPSWEVSDIQGGFAPATDGFGFNSNVCHMGVFPGESVGDPTTFTLDPPYAPVSVRNRVTTSAEGSGWIELNVTGADTVVVIRGEIPKGDDGEYLWIPVQNPALYYGRALAHALEKRGIALNGTVRVDPYAPPPAVQSSALYAHFSEPLPAILSVMNKESDNYLAEYILRALGASTSFEGCRRTGIHAVEQFIKKCGIDRHDVALDDGSGLTRQNLATARAIVQLLKTMHNRPDRYVFMSTLSISGKDGTLAYRFSTPEMAERVQAKTGTMTQISTLAGYATDAAGDPIAFAILCNHFNTSVRHVRAVQDRLLERLITEYTH